ncbi:MAG: hypothetical protein JNG88_09205 [Phycisphaerales bacterium]|nr:hypothetical protein [Phycisphaerales bacterium]
MVGSISSLLSLIVFAAVGVALVILRLRSSDPAGRSGASQAFRVPLSVGRVPIAPVLLIVATIALATQFRWLVHIVSAAAICAGILLSFTRRWWQRPQGTRPYAAKESGS